MRAKDITLMALLCALLLVVQYALSFVYGIELVTLLVMVTCAVLDMRRSVMTVTAFALLRNLLYPPALDALILYVTFYPLFAALLCLMNKTGVKSALFYSLVGVGSVLVFDAYSVLLIHVVAGTPLPGLLVGQILPTAIRIPVVFVSVLALFSPLFRLLKRLQSS